LGVQVHGVNLVIFHSYAVQFSEKLDWMS